MDFDSRPVFLADGMPRFKLDQKLLLSQPLYVFDIHSDPVVLEIPGCQRPPIDETLEFGTFALALQLPLLLPVAQSLLQSRGRPE